MCISCPPITPFFYSLMLHTAIQLRKDLVVERSFDKNMSLNNFLNSNFCPFFMRSCNFSMKETFLVRNSPTNKNNVTKLSWIIISKLGTQGIYLEFIVLYFWNQIRITIILVIWYINLMFYWIYNELDIILEKLKDKRIQS